ncbi:MAG TPA: YceD family protein [Caldimonas sp.]|nr:YceD family protein [Caldimonas sp.]HEX4234919.1 YceD family protein [Caldimonas sp.]
MASREFDPRRLDVAAFAAAAGELAGEFPAEALPRLASATLAPAADLPRPGVRWRVDGERRPLPGAGVQASLLVTASADVTLECQRCLQPMQVPLRAGRRIFFVDGEDAAEALDAENEDDVLALAPVLDLPALIEDELLLALPLVPRHEVCPEPLPRGLVDGDPAAVSAENPFAVLAALKQGSRPN